MRQLFATLLLLVCVSPAIAQPNWRNPDPYTARFWLKPCKNLLEGKKADLYRQGACMGMIEGLEYAGYPCVVLDATQNWMLKIVVEFFESNPGRLDEQFLPLAWEALNGLGCTYEISPARKEEWRREYQRTGEPPQWAK